MQVHSQSKFASQLADAALSTQIAIGKMWRSNSQICELQRQVVALRRRYKSESDPSLADALVELAFTLHKEPEGDREADSILAEAVTILTKRKDAPLRAARAAHLRANVNERLGNLSLAIDLHEQAETGYKRFNPLSWIRLANLGSLATLYRKTKRMDLAGRYDRLAEDLHHILEMSSPRMMPG